MNKCLQNFSMLCIFTLVEKKPLLFKGTTHFKKLSKKYNFKENLSGIINYFEVKNFLLFNT